VNAERRVRLWRLMVELAGGRPVGLDHLCRVAIVSAGVTAAAVTLTLATTPRENLFASDQLAADLEELALTLGEGPGVDAGSGVPALVADLSSVDAYRRWPAFAPAACLLGVRAVFALPLQIGAIRLGVLDLFRGAPGDLEPAQLADSLVLADTACTLLLDAGRRDRAYPDGSPPELVRPQRPEVHQATGMLAVQLGVSVAVALVRLRAYAYAQERSLADVARDVVHRRLRFVSDSEGGDGVERNG
jgi:ANTAR domain